MYKKTFIMTDNNNQYFGVPVYFFLTISDILHLNANGFNEELTEALEEKDITKICELFVGLVLASAHFKEFGKYTQPVDKFKKFANTDEFMRFVLALLGDPEESTKFIKSIIDIQEGGKKWLDLKYIKRFH